MSFQARVYNHLSWFLRGLISITALLLPLCISAAGCLGPDTERNTGEFFGWGCTAKEMSLPDQGTDKDMSKQSAVTPDDGTQGGEVLQYEAEDRVLIWKAGNDGGIEGGGGTPPKVIHDRTYYVVEVSTYHAGWGPDAPDPSGTISLKAADGTVYARLGRAGLSFGQGEHTVGIDP